MITLGIDPGCVNFALCALDGRGRVVFAYMLGNTVRSMSMHEAHQRRAFRHTMRLILRHVRPDQLMIETYVARGFGTVQTELVNIMIGGIMMECDHLGISEHATMASSWKNEVGRHYGGTGWVPPKEGSPTARSKSAMAHAYRGAERLHLPPHLVDALLLATYLHHGKSLSTASWTLFQENLRRIDGLVPLNRRVKPKAIRKARPRRREPKPAPAPTKRKKKESS